MEKVRKLILAIDFDGTIVQNKFPLIGYLKKNAKQYINKLHDEHNCEIIIWTCRQNQPLKDAIEFLITNDIKFDYVNENSDEMKNTYKQNPNSRKVFGDLYIDDHNIFMKYIDWENIYNEILNYKNSNKQKFI